MNLSNQWSVFCENEHTEKDRVLRGCRDHDFLDGRTKREAAAEAKRLGWVERDGKTLCPACDRLADERSHD